LRSGPRTGLSSNPTASARGTAEFLICRRCGVYIGAVCSSPAGAAELGRRIRAFWSNGGYDIQVEVIHADGRRESPVYGVRSDMIGGLPAVHGRSE
jgi:hypothetical protein